MHQPTKFARPLQKQILRPIIYSVAILTILAGCAADLQPYVYVSSEFDRTRKDYGKPLKDRNEVIICFNKHKTTPKIISNMAVLECARFNKRAVYVKQEPRLCPLMTPISAHYQCVDDSKVDDSKNETSSSR